MKHPDPCKFDDSLRVLDPSTHSCICDVPEGYRRHDMTSMCYTDQVTLEEFVQEIKSSLDPFYANMIHLRKSKTLSEFYNSKHHIEEWFEVFARWTEIQSEGFDPFIAKQ